MPHVSGSKKVIYFIEFLLKLRWRILSICWFIWIFSFLYSWNGKLSRKSFNHWLFRWYRILYRCENWIDGYEYFNLECWTWLSFHWVSFIFKYDKFKCSSSVISPTTPLHRHRKQHISLVASLLPLKLLRNSEATRGDEWKDWHKREIHMDQSHWTAKPWSLVVILLAG